jgi:hypothetical protein
VKKVTPARPGLLALQDHLVLLVLLANLEPLANLVHQAHPAHLVPLVKRELPARPVKLAQLVLLELRGLLDPLVQREPARLSHRHQWVSDTLARFTALRLKTICRA